MKSFRSKKKPVLPGRRLADREARPDEFSAQQFRRNQTMSGVRRETLAEASSPRSKVHHLTRQRRKVASILAIVLVGIGILALLLTQLTAKVTITSSTTLSTAIEVQKYEKVINDYLGLNPAGRLRFILNEKELSDYVAAVTPEVASVKQTGSQQMVETRFAITFRHPLAGWQINTNQYYVDDQGVVFEKNYFDTPGVQIVDESGISPEQGTTVASARLLSFVGRVVGLAKDSGYEVTQAILPSGTTRQLEIRLKGITPLVKLSIDRGAGEQVEDMARSLRYLVTEHGQSPSYVDVRVSGRAVYQ